MEKATFVAVSGINFPTKSRKYLIDLTAEIAELHTAQFLVIAGHTMAGKDLEKQFKDRVKDIKGSGAQEAKEREYKNFIEEITEALNEFLPKNTINWHIVVAEKIYDKPIGTAILKNILKIRGDIRVFEDPETKIPIQLQHYGSMRVVVPKKEPWFYENVTGLMQRVINGFSSRTFSPKPPIIIVGCTGTGAYLPQYKGVPSIAIPALHKLDEQRSTENMVGCTVVTIIKEEEGIRIIWKVYDFRLAIFNEQEFVVKETLSENEKKVLDTLKPSSASIGTIQFKINSTEKKPWNEKKVQKYVSELQKQKLIDYREQEHRYKISKELAKQNKITLADFLKNKKTITTVNKSCWHVGALKTLYFSVLQNEPNLAETADAIILNGDGIQGISHNYEYNGETGPGMNGADKHELLAAKMQAKIIMDVFEKRWNKVKGEWEKQKTKDAQSLEVFIEKCFVTFIYKYGNHDEPRFSHSKHAIPLLIFDTVLRNKITTDILAFLEKKQNMPLFEIVRKIVDKKIVRVGESRVAVVNGIPIGIKHPYQARAQGKGIRIQQTAAFFEEKMKEWANKEFQNIAIVKVANFHEAGAIFTSIFGKTIFGVMTASQVQDTQFESNMNKVVEHSLARVNVDVNDQGQILATEVEYDNTIVPEDRKIVFAETLSSEAILEYWMKLYKMFDISWR